jgi:hypothetical protein
LGTRRELFEIPRPEPELHDPITERVEAVVTFGIPEVR